MKGIRRMECGRASGLSSMRKEGSIVGSGIRIRCKAEELYTTPMVS
jgi:hypothetical protein